MSLRPRKSCEAYLRLHTLPGEQAQVDWGHFDYVQIGRAKRPLMAFLMALSWSRQLFLRFYLNQRMESFLRGHVAAFEARGGLPRILPDDNLKSAVLEHREDAIRFHPTLLALSAHYQDRQRRDDEENPGDNASPGTVQLPTDTGRQLLCLRVRKHHRVIQRMQEPAL